MATANVERLREQVGEVVAKHTRAKNITEFSAYADDPGGFLRDVLRCHPWSRQVEMAEAMRDHRQTVVVTANGIGKDFLVARAALWWAYARRGLCILSGPTERQVKHILMREIRQAFSRAPELPGELYSMELRLDDRGEAGIIGFTSDNADRLTGFHHPRLLICLTEGQGIGEESYEASRACLTGPENRLFVYGNPTRPTGPFYRAASSEAWHRIRVPAIEHPNVITGREEIPGAVSREWIQAMRDEYGESSSIYRARVEAIFPEESAEGLIRREWLRAAVARWESKELEDQTISKPSLLALDVARFGADESVLAHVHGPVVHELVTWRGFDLKQSAEKVEAYGNALAQATTGSKWAGKFAGHTPTCYVDEPGMGAGVVDILRGRYPVVGFNGANRPFDRKRFANRRSEVIWNLRDLLEGGKVALPPDDNLQEELLATEWVINPAGQIQIVGKDLLKKEIGRSPDRMDAVVIGLAYAMPPAGGGFQRFRFAI